MRLNVVLAFFALFAAVPVLTRPIIHTPVGVSKRSTTIKIRRLEPRNARPKCETVNEHKSGPERVESACAGAVGVVGFREKSIFSKCRTPATGSTAEGICYIKPAETVAGRSPTEDNRSAETLGTDGESTKETPQSGSNTPPNIETATKSSSPPSPSNDSPPPEDPPIKEGPEAENRLSEDSPTNGPPDKGPLERPALADSPAPESPTEESPTEEAPKEGPLPQGHSSEITSTGESTPEKPSPGVDDQDSNDLPGDDESQQSQSAEEPFTEDPPKDQPPYKPLASNSKDETLTAKPAADTPSDPKSNDSPEADGAAPKNRPPDDLPKETPDDVSAAQTPGADLGGTGDQLPQAHYKLTNQTAEEDAAEISKGLNESWKIAGGGVSKSFEKLDKEILETNEASSAGSEAQNEFPRPTPPNRKDQLGRKKFKMDKWVGNRLFEVFYGLETGKKSW